jgi:hypothetical protein
MKIDEETLLAELAGVQRAIIAAPPRSGKTSAMARHMRSVKQAWPELTLVMRSLSPRMEQVFAAQFPDLTFRTQYPAGAQCALFVDEGLLFSPDALEALLAAQCVYIYTSFPVRNETHGLAQKGFIFLEAPLL